MPTSPPSVPAMDGAAFAHPDRRDAGATIPTPRRARPVLWWAALGAAFFAMQVGVWIRWATSERFTTTTVGRSEVPEWMRYCILFFQVSTSIALVYVVWRWIVRPIRREGRFSIEGMLCLSFLLMWWQDPFANYTQVWVAYNTALANFGSWTTDTPGWVSPLGHQFGEPFAWIAPTLAVVFAGITFMGAWILRQVKARHPHLGKLGLLAVLFAAMLVVDLLLEVLWMRFGVYSYGGSIRWMTIFPGHYYQFPLYEAVLVAFVMTAFSALVYFRNDNGETVAERHSTELRVSSHQRTLLRFFAELGVTHALFTGFNITIQWFVLRADEWPQDVLDRPYLRDGLCGPDTPYSCSGPGVPIPREHSVHLDPDGNLVIPDGVSVRDESLIEQ